MPIKPSVSNHEMPAMDENRRLNANLAPQGEVNPDDKDNSLHTPEGDGEEDPEIEPDEND